MRRKILVVFGTRPEAIKLAPVIRALEASSSLQPCVCVTGQHREMLDQMLALFQIHTQHDLAVMEPDQDLFDLTSRLLPRLRAALDAERPHAVLVQGDTTSTFVAALAAYYRRIPTGHVEAGLRTGKPYDPFPEEINRRLTTHIAAWHFAPTPRAQQNLLREGVPAGRIVVTGNTIVDALHHIVEALQRGIVQFVPAIPAGLATGRRIVLVTGHRRESFGEGLRNICTALLEIARRHEDVLIVYPVHLNPAVQQPVRSILAGHPRIVLTPPLDYLPFVDLMQRAYVALTDSGGVQEEAPSLRLPVLVMREATERPEGIEAGVARLVGTTSAAIVAAAGQLLTDRELYEQMRATDNPYGDGHAADAIVAHLERAVAAPVV